MKDHLSSLQCFLNGLKCTVFPKFDLKTRTLVGCHVPTQGAFNAILASINIISILYWSYMIHDFSSVSNKHRNDIKNNSYITEMKWLIFGKC